MNSTAATGTVPVTNSYSLARRAFDAWWAAWRDPIAGCLMVIGLCWPFVFSSVLPVRWWMFLPCAVLGGLMRQQSWPRPWRAFIPLWGFLVVFLGFAAWAAALSPLSEYGSEKFMQFIGLAGLACLAAWRQAPLTEGLGQGMRWTLGITLAVSLVIAVFKRDMFLDTELYGLNELRQSFSITGFPVAIALAACWAIPREIKPGPLFLGAALVLGGALLEVFVRGRFLAMALCAVAGLMVLGPPWRGYFWRVSLSGILAVLVLAIYVNVVPLLGDSFLYLEWLNLENAGGRSALFSEALSGFWAHPLGQGIGSFALQEPNLRYPHNVVLESAYELGVLGLAAMGAIYLTVARRVWQLWLSPPHRVLAAITALVFANNLKAGDISSLGFQWVFLYLLVVCTPLAPSWPLVRRRVGQ